MTARAFSLTTLLGTLLILPGMAGAQALQNTDPFTLSVAPQYPAPYSRVTLTPISATLDLANTTLTLILNNKQFYEGGAQTVAVPVGAPGTLTTIKATLNANGTKYTKTLIIRPQDVVLVAEPISSAPVLYPGKPLVPLGGNVRVVALANFKDAKGKSISPSALGYSWTVDDTRIANSSGIGKDTLIVAAPLQYRDRTVSVTVTSQDGTVASGASLSLASREPTVRIYRNDSLLGILYDRALADTYAIPGAEASLYAVGYSFPTNTQTPSFQWFLNGASAQNGSSITLRPAGSGQGKASLSLIATAGDNVSKTLNLSLSFGAEAKNSFFGL